MELTVSQILEEFKAKHGFTDEQMVSALGISRGSIQVYRSGKLKGTISKQRKYLELIKKYEASLPTASTNNVAVVNEAEVTYSTKPSLSDYERIIKELKKEIALLKKLIDEKDSTIIAKNQFIQHLLEPVVKKHIDGKK